MLGHFASFIDRASLRDNTGERRDDHLKAALRKWLVDYSVAMFRHKLLLPSPRPTQS